MKLLCFWALMIFLLVISGVSARSIVGISPGAVHFKDVLRGGYAERHVTISVDSGKEIGLEIEPRGEIEEWLEFNQSLVVSDDKPARLFISVSPPSDVPNGNYTGFLRVSTDALGEVPPGHAVAAVRADIDIAITVEITDQEIVGCFARNFRVESVERGDDIVFEASVSNEGNIRLRPTIKIDIWDQEQITLVRNVELRGEEILPTREKALEFSLPSDDFELDQYWADVEIIECYSGDTLTFDVLEPGALKANGILRKIFTVPWAEIGETIEIIVDFENVGEKDVNAKFRGKITRDGEIVRLLESEEIIAPISELTNFSFFFTPENEGKYIASGRVFYDKKRTFEGSTIFHVRPNIFTFKEILLTLVYVILIVVIGFLFYRVKKERKKYLRKIGRVSRG